MRFRLLMDEDSLHESVLNALRRRGFDCTTVVDADRRSGADHGQLEYATAMGRVMFTRNTGDFSALHREWSAAGKEHAEIIVLTEQRMPVGTIERAMLRIASVFDADDIRGQLVHLRNYVIYTPRQTFPGGPNP
ncbi:MAG: DUF5615 family PIN-like protein [Dehalococcoidia bacterium]